jgi:N-acetylmuramidase
MRGGRDLGGLRHRKRGERVSARKRPKILFEAHVFGRLTRHRWDEAHPNVSSPSWNRALYGADGARQYDRLAEAVALDRAAALQSASWGMFQILGLNYADSGFGSVEDFVTAMCTGEGAQLEAFAAFCRHNGLDRALRARDWTRFALGYNGPGEAENDYDGKLAAAYRHRAEVIA